MKLNIGQKQVLSEFYSNFALAWITFGLISPVFIGVDNAKIFVLKLTVSTIATFFFLSVSLGFRK